MGGELVSGGLELWILRLGQPVRDLGLEVADRDDGVVRLADLVANPDRQLELRLEIGVGGAEKRVALDEKILRLGAAVGGPLPLANPPPPPRPPPSPAPQHLPPQPHPL